MKLIKMFKEWYNLAKPNKKYWILQFVTVTISSFCLLIEAYLAACVTSMLVNGNFKMAVTISILALLIVVIRCLVWDINYKNTTRLISYSYYKIQDKVIDKIIKSSDTNYAQNSNEKITNIMHNDIYDTAAFADNLCNRFRFLISIIICVGFIISINVIVAFAVFIGLVLLYFIRLRINESIAKAKVLQRKAMDDEYEICTQLIEAKNIAKEYDMTNEIRHKVREKSMDFFEGKRKHYKASSYGDNYYLLIYKTFILLITFIVMALLRDSIISLSIYLTIVAYVTDTLTNSATLFTVFTDFKNSYVSTSRVNIILNFDDRSELELGSINKTDLNGEIDFVRVNYKAKIDEFKVTDLKDISFHISSAQAVLFKGPRGCGKRTIFYMLRRLIKQDSGDTYLDKIRITDYSEKAYLNNISFILTKPYFFKSSIIDNLKMITKNEKEIINALERVNLYEDFMALPNQLDTNILQLNQRDLYLLGIARSILFKNEVLLVYEFPTYLSQKDTDNVKNILNTLNMKKTVIYFSANNMCDDLVDKIYNVANGEVKMVKVNAHRKAKLMFDITKLED